MVMWQAVMQGDRFGFPGVGCVACTFLRRTAVAAAEFLRVVVGASGMRIVAKDSNEFIQSAQKGRNSELRCVSAVPFSFVLRDAREPSLFLLRRCRAAWLACP